MLKVERSGGLRIILVVFLSVNVSISADANSDF